MVNKKTLRMSIDFLYRKSFFYHFLVHTTALIPISIASAQTVVPPNGDIPTYVAGGNYNLSLGGQVAWNSSFYIDSLPRSNLSIDGNGNTILVGNFNPLIIDFTRDNSVSIKRSIVRTNAAITVERPSLFQYITAATNSNLALEGSTFSGFSHSGLGGSIFYVYGAGANVRVDGGAAGVTFSNNRGSTDAGGVASVYFGSLTFDGKTTFDSNWTGNYGGAVSVYQAQNFS